MEAFEKTNYHNRQNIPNIISYLEINNEEEIDRLNSWNEI